MLRNISLSLIILSSTIATAGVEYYEEGMIDGETFVRAGGYCGSGKWSYEQRGFSNTLTGPLGTIKGYYTPHPPAAEAVICLTSYGSKESGIQRLKQEFGNRFIPSN